MKEAKKISESMTEQVYLVRASQINGYGRLFGGILMQWIDELAGIVAKRHCQEEITTAAIDNLNFKSGAFSNDMVVLVGKVTHVGKTSMEVRVDTYIEGLDGVRKNINRAYLVMVAIDKNEKPLEVPGLILETENDKIEWESGKRRYELRKQRRREGF